MLSLAIHGQIEQARAYLDVLSQLEKTGLAESCDPSDTTCTELRDINLRLAALADRTSQPPEGAAPAQASAPAPSTTGEPNGILATTHLASILDQIDSVAVIYDRSGVVLLANRFARHLFGFDPLYMEREQLFRKLTICDEQGQPIPPEQMPASRASRGEIVENARMEITNGQGQVFYVAASAAQVRDENGTAGVVSIWNDYTEHMHAKAALENANTEIVNERNRLLAMMEALPIGVAIINNKGGITHANKGYDEAWGSPRPVVNTIRDYAAYKGWWAETGQPVQPEEWASAQAIHAGKTVINQFIEIQRFDGKCGFVLNSAAPVYDAQGSIVGCAVAMRDITERVVAERALQVSEERFRVALTSLPMSVFTLDMDLRYTWIYSPPFGLTEEQIIGKRDADFYQEVPASFTADQRTVLETGQGIRREVQVRVGEEWKTLHVSLEPLRGPSGKIIGLIGAVMDMTEQRRAEAEHNDVRMQMELQRLLLEHREHERQEIAREIHDGPIQTLVGQMYSLHGTKEDITDPQLLRVAEEIAAGLRSTVKELRDVVNELRPPVLIQYGLARAIQIHSEDFRAKYPDIDLTLDLVEDANLLPEDTCLALYRIYQESLNNVIRHAKASTISVRYYPVNSHVVLEIKDNGEGFTPPTDWVTLTRGNHYGLAGMRERVEAIGGKMYIKSAPGQGVQVTVRVPVKRPNL